MLECNLAIHIERVFTQDRSGRSALDDQEQINSPGFPSDHPNESEVLNFDMVLNMSSCTPLTLSLLSIPLILC